jgi:hypothetical protein
MNVILFNIKNTIMATLETQYKNFLSDNPDSKITFEEWEKMWTSKYVNTMSGIEEYIHNINNWRGSDLSDWDVTLMDGLENEPSYVSDDFQIGPDGAYEHSDREIDVTNTLKQLVIHLLRVEYTNGDLSDIGNEVGVAVGETLENLSESEVSKFIFGFRHGVSLTNKTHGVISFTRSTNHGQGDGC